MKTQKLHHYLENKSLQKGSMWDIFSYFHKEKYASDQIKQKLDKIEMQNKLSNYLHEQVLDLSAKKEIEQMRHSTYHQNLIKHVDSLEKSQRQKHQKYLRKLEDMYNYNKANIKDPSSISIFTKQKKSIDKQLIENDVKDYNTQEYVKRTQLLNLAKQAKLQDLHQIEIKKNSKQVEKEMKHFEEQMMIEHQSKLLEKLENDQK